ncbi:MAG: 16S rRNA (cytidine(1402)-2'-O)-methyltransferase [Desulfomonilaceae bacterium]
MEKGADRRASDVQGSTRGDGPGVLFVVATPIGNLDDITFRAVEVLKKVDFIACEDTRRSRILLEKFQIAAERVSLHRFTERKKADKIIQRIVRGESCALICDAGAPAVSDPGALLVNEAHNAGIRVVPIPGPSSVMAALSASGIDCATFVFRGFIPRKITERLAFFEDIRQDPRPAVMFESPKRIAASLRTAHEILGPRPVVLARELTKVHEEILRGSAAQIAEELARRESVQGEICMIVGPGFPQASEVDARQAVRELMEQGLTGKALAHEAHQRYGIKKSLAYKTFLELNNDNER